MRRHAILGSDFRSEEGRHHATTHRRHTPAVWYATVPHPSHGRYAHAEQVYNLYFLEKRKARNFPSYSARNQCSLYL